MSVKVNLLLCECRINKPTNFLRKNLPDLQVWSQIRNARPHLSVHHKERVSLREWTRILPKSDKLQPNELCGTNCVSRLRLRKFAIILPRRNGSRENMVASAQFGALKVEGLSPSLGPVVGFCHGKLRGKKST